MPPSRTSLISCGRSATDRGRAAVKMDVGKEQFLPVQLDSVRYADIADSASRTGGPDCLHHRLLRSNAFEDRVSSDAFGQFLNTGNAVVSTLGHNVGRSELFRQLLPHVMAAHRDDALGSHLFCGKYTKQADRAVTHDDNRRAGLHIGCICRKPTRQKASTNWGPVRLREYWGSKRASHRPEERGALVPG